jgi:hypothetical protein
MDRNSGWWIFVLAIVIVSGIFALFEPGSHRSDDDHE